jgi:hypothetical protein
MTKFTPAQVAYLAATVAFEVEFAKKERERLMANGATKVVFFESGGQALGEYLMYNPPVTGDDVTWGEATYTVVRRNVDVYDNMVRVTVKRADNA